MNREILFRGKRIDNGEWVEGQYAYLLNPRTKDGEPIKHMILDGTPFGQTVDPTTIGQYTGLTDKNGKKIFEGDIVRLERWVPSCGKTEVVKYYDGGFAPFSVAGWECTADWKECEVIGNIHDNYELLEGD